MTWDEKFMGLAQQYSSWSKDPSSRIGAIAVNPITKQILSGGYNGFPRGIEDTVERLSDRPTKYKYVVHAEANMIYNATYTGVSLNGSHVYIYGLPICSECAKAIIQVGVKKVYMLDSHVIIASRWEESWKLTKDMFKESGIEIELLTIKD